MRSGSARDVSASTVATTEADEQAALKAAQPIDAAMITYHESGSFPVALREPRALAVDSDLQIYVGGDRSVIRYSSDGEKLREITLQKEPSCLAVGAFDHVHPGQLYVGLGDHIEVFDRNGLNVMSWKTPGPNTMLTSIATTEREIWAADVGDRVVWQFDALGRVLNSFGKPNPVTTQPGFLVTNHYFDLAAGTDDLIYVVNPRLLHVEGYTRSGELECQWGEGSPAVSGFFGCCNPAQLAVLPDGRFATAEKGLPRVKIYSRDGKFQTVVAGPSELSNTPADLAVDRHGRILVLDGRAAKVRVFVKNPGPKDTASPDKEAAKKP